MQHERPGDHDLVTTDDLSRQSGGVTVLYERSGDRVQSETSGDLLSGVPGKETNAAQGSNILDGSTASSGQENQNWITALIALKFAKEGLEHVTLTLIENLHKQIKIKLETNVRQCNGCNVNFTNKKPVVKCPANDCNMWVNEILKYTAVNHDLNWDIVSLEEIKKKPWKMAALFLPAHCYAFQGPQETDITSLLTLLSKCTFFNEYVPVKQVEELRKIAENLIVSSSMKIGDRNELIKEIDCIIGVLQHHDMYKYDEKCRQAVQKTNQLRDAEYEPGLSDEHYVISELITWMKQKIQSLRREMARAKNNYDKCRSDYHARTLANQLQYSTPDHGTSKDETGRSDQKQELEIESINTKEKYEAITSEGEKVENTIQMLMYYGDFRGKDQWSDVYEDLCRVRQESKDLSKKVMKYIWMVEHDLDEWQQPDRFSDKGYLNWVKACLVLRHGKEGMEDFVAEVIKQLHDTIKINIEKSQKNEKYAWIESLKQHSAYKKEFSEIDVDIQCLKETPWKLIDVYLGSYHKEKKDPNRPGVPTKPKEPQELDMSAFVKLMLKCSAFRGYVAEKTVDKVRRIRNEIFHSPSMRIDEDSVFERYTMGVLDLLNEIKTNSNTKNLQTAVERIERIRDNQDVPRAVHEKQIFKSHVESMEQELQSKEAKLETVTVDQYHIIIKEIYQIETTCQRYGLFIDFQMIDEPEIKKILDKIITKTEQIIIDAKCKCVIDKTKQECDKDLNATKSQLEELLSENNELRQKKRELKETISNYTLENYHRKLDGHCWACHKLNHCPCTQ